MKNYYSIRIFSLILLFNLFQVISSLEIPLKLVKSKKQRRRRIKIPSLEKMISENIKTLDNYLFAIDVTVGSDKQPFTLILDTGSNIVWVPGIITEGSDKYYNPQTSTTSKRTSDSLSYQYFDGSISGQYYYDQFNFMLPNDFYFYFGVANRINLGSINEFDGIIGLGRDYNSNDKKYSILQTIKTNGAITSTRFSFKYNYDTNNLTLYVGETHEDFKKSNIASCPLIDSEIYETKLWLCDLYSFSVKNENEIIKIIDIEYEGIFDTGTNNMVFPLEILEEFKSIFINFNCYIYDESKTEKSVHCRDGNNLPKISFGLKNYVLTLGQSNFYNKLLINNEYIYRLRLLFIDGIETCIIGQNFFYEFHTLFDGDNYVMKFYNENEGSIIKQSAKTSIKLWVLLVIIIGSVVVLGSTIFIVVYCLCCRKRAYTPLKKELLEMSSIQKIDDENNNNDNNYLEQDDKNNFNQIMNITTTKKSSSFNKKIKNKKEIKFYV